MARNSVRIAGFVGLMLLTGLGAGCSLPSNGALGSKSPTPATVVTASAAATTPESTFVPRPEDFAIDVLVTRQACFGSAGCNVTFTVNPRYLGTQTIPADATFTVVYEIIGGESPQKGSVKVQGTQTRYDSDTTISTPEGAELTARVVQIIDQ